MVSREKGGEITLVICFKLTQMMVKIGVGPHAFKKIYINFVMYKVGELGLIAPSSFALQNDQPYAFMEVMNLGNLRWFVFIWRQSD